MQTVFRIAFVVILIILIVPFQDIRAATGPYVIAVDGLAGQQVGPGLMEWLRSQFSGQGEVEKGYLAEALTCSPEIGQSGAEIHAFAWSRDPGDSSRFIRKLTKEIQDVYQEQTRGRRPLVIVAHSWGTVLSYAALHALRGDVAINGFISLGSPLNPSPLSLEKGFLTLETLKESLPPGLLFNSLKKPVSLKGPWFNYFAEKDLYSSQLGPADNYQIDQEAGSEALRVIQAPETEKWHREYYTKPENLSRISDNLKSIARGGGSQNLPPGSQAGQPGNATGPTTPAGAKPAAPDMTVMGMLTWYSEKNRTFWCIAPWVVSKDNSYSSIHINEINELDEVRNAALQRRQALRLLNLTFWLYDRGVEIGTLEVQAGVVASDKASWPGKVSWKGKPLHQDDLGHKEIVALSRPIPQNFWLPLDRLTPEQASGFRQRLTAALTRPPAVSKSGAHMKPPAGQRPVGKITEKHFQVMDLDQDGQLEVFGELKSEGKPCTTMVADLFATWQGGWQVLWQATYWAYCPQAEAVGDPYFKVIPVDLDGDGRAEVFIQHIFYETWGISLFHYQGGRLIKQLDFGDGGV
jgi:hypothetical protein